MDTLFGNIVMDSVSMENGGRNAIACLIRESWLRICLISKTIPMICWIAWNEIYLDCSVKRTSNHSEQWLFREEVLSFTQEKAKAFSLLFVPLLGGGMEI